MMELYNYDFSIFSDDDINEYGYFGYSRIDDYWNKVIAEYTGGKYNTFTAKEENEVGLTFDNSL